MASRTIKIIIETRGEQKATKAFRKLSLGAKNVGSAVSLARAELRRLKSTQARLSQSTEKLGFIQKRLTASYLAGNIAARSISAAVSTLARVMRSGIGAAVSFEFTIEKIAQISGIVGEELKSLEGSIRDIANQSPKTATQVAQAALEMSKMGLAGKELEDSLEGVVALSVALDEEVSTVGQTMVSVKNVFKQDASELTNIADKMFTTLGNSALNLEKFSTAFSFAGASARLAGISFEELSGLMGVLADNGIKASTIGTQLRQVFTRLDNPLSKVSKTIGANSLRTKGLRGTLQALVPVINDSGDAYNLFGQRAISVVDILLKNIDSIEELAKQTENMEKSTKTAAEALLKTMAGASAEVTSAFQDLNIELSKVYAPVVITGLKLVSSLLRSIASIGDTAGPTVEQVELGISGGGNLLRGNISPARNLPSDITKALAEQQLLRKQLAKDFLQQLKDDKQRRQIAKTTAEENKRAAEKLHEQSLKILADDIKGLNDKITLNKILVSLERAQILPQEGLESEAEAFALRAKKLNSLSEEISALTIIKKLKDEEDKRFQVAEKMFEDAGKRKDKADKAEREALSNRLEIEEHNMELIQERLMFTDELSDALERQASFQSAAITSIVGGIDSVSRGFAEALLSGKNFGDVMKVVLKQLVIDLISTIIKTLILKAIIGALTGGPTFLPSGFGPGGLADLTGGGLSSSGFPLFPKAAGFQGQVSQPTAFIAGEEGPEDVIIKPRAKTGANNAGKTIVVNIQGDVFGEQKFMEAVRIANEDLDRETINV